VITHKVYVPGAPDIKATDRFTFRGDTYQIHAVRNIDELDRFLTLEVTQGTTPSAAGAGA
jgi:head-tail adaptor